MDDQSLLALLENDPQRGMTLLMDRYLPLVSTVVRGRLEGVGSRPDAEECVSDVFAQFYLQRESVDLSRGTVKGYLCAIARNKALSLRKSLLRTDPLPEGWDSPDERADTEERILLAERRSAVLQAVLRLEPVDREIIVRKYFYRQSSAETARHVGMTVSAVDTRTHRALKKLRQILGEELL